MFALLSFLLLEAPLSYVYTCACACFANENQAIQQPDNEIREGVWYHKQQTVFISAYLQVPASRPTKS